MQIISKQAQKAIHELLDKDIQTSQDLMLEKRRTAKKYKIIIPTNAQIISEYNKLSKTGKIKGRQQLLSILKKRAIRTLSGIAPVAVLTKPWPCPGKCIYCPTEKNVPQSYLSNEPAVMRAIRCNYNPYIQVQDRLRALIANGHQPTKIELIVIGGTWSYLPKKYKYWYIANCFKATNDFLSIKYKVQSPRHNMKNNIEELKQFLFTEQKRNERAKYKIIGLTLETRPDYIDEKELQEMRELGCTRVEIGVQQIDDDILKFNKRGHGVKEIVDATRLLKDYGFKVTYHLMPGLPGSSVQKDFKMFKTLFSDERFQPDQIKFYPTVVTKGSLLYKWWKQGKYKPYTDRQLRQLIVKCKQMVPRYVRIIRLIRDIPGESIIAGNKITNLRQVMKDEGVRCQCIRCREARDLQITDYKLNIIKYQVSRGEEYFISFESKDSKTLYGFCRLRLAEEALIRELHVYGELVPVGERKPKVQHIGLGKELLKIAEQSAKEKKYNKLKIISGIGVRGYYRKLGYRLQGTYMVKKIQK